MKKKTLTNQIDFSQITKNKNVRRTLGITSHYYFFNIYFSHYVKHPTAPFQRELFRITEDEDIDMAVIVAFRGSAKSTIMSLSYPIWAILGKLQKKFVIVSSQTQEQSRLILSNIKDELESNSMLVHDFGPFIEDSDEWRAGSLVIPELDARITAISTGGNIRGVRHREYRPDLIVLDDIESIDSVRTIEGRNKTHKWLTGDVIPAGDINSKYIIIGNLLHEDSLIMRMKKSIEAEHTNGIFRSFPLLDKEDQPLWPGKFSNPEKVETLKKQTSDEISWQREYMLKIVPDVDRVVQREWLHTYRHLPKRKRPCMTATGIDLAISQKTSADCTAMVSAKVYGTGNDAQIYILPNPVNERLTYPQTRKKIIEVCKALGDGQRTQIFIETVAYQEAMSQDLLSMGYPTGEYKPGNKDKRSRIAYTTHWIQDGRILFPEQGAEDLIAQLVGFGIERHDDLADAFTCLIHMLQDHLISSSSGLVISLGPSILSELGPPPKITMDMKF